MPGFVEWDQLRNHPEPAYPEYAGLLAEAERAARGFVNPAALYEYERIARDRGPDWCSAVLGFPYGGSVRTITTVEAELLRLADQRELDPPLPARVIAWREEDAARRAERDAEVAAARAAAVQRSDDAYADALVELERRPNLNARRGPETHFVPSADCRSARRRHRAGRPLCETEGRPRPRTLGEPTTDPVTCVACLRFAAEVAPECPTCGGRLAWCEDQWHCRACGNEWHDQQVTGDVAKED